MEFTSKEKTTLIVLLALAVLGVGVWAFQLASGSDLTSMSNAVSWGSYIAAFMFFEGVSAGALIVAAAGEAFGINRLKGLFVPALVVATAFMCLAGGSILMDLGNLGNVWRMMAGPQLSSPLVWDMCAITLYLVACIVALVFAFKGREDKARKMAVLLLVLAFAVLCVGAWIFGLQVAREWHSAIMGPIFFASALDSGLAALLIVLVCLDKAGARSMEPGLLPVLGKLLLGFICIDALFILCEVVTMAYTGGSSGQALAQMVSGATAPWFWAEVVGGLAIPFAILASAGNRENPTMVLAGSVLVVCGVACKRLWLLVTSFVAPNVYGAPGISLGTAEAQADPAAMWGLVGSYAPSIPELLTFLGMLSLGVAAVIVLAKALASK